MRDEAKAEAILRDPGAAPLSKRERALCDYALALTREPGGDHRAPFERLRREGLDDRAILDAAQVTAYFNFVNRLGEGLGVELEPERKP